jgi:hypothetical protein
VSLQIKLCRHRITASASSFSVAVAEASVSGSRTTAPATRRVHAKGIFFKILIPFLINILILTAPENITH